jgi:hypothetical protein
MRQAAADVDVEIAETILGRPDASEPNRFARHIRYAARSAESLALVELSASGGGPPGTVACQNPDYGFLLARRSPGGTFEVKDYAPRAEDEVGRVSSSSMISLRSQGPEAGFRLLWLVLPDLIRAAEFELAGIESFSDSDREMVRMRFHYALPNDGPRSIQFIDACSVVLDPTNYWAVRNWELPSTIGTFRGKVAYQEGASSVPFPAIYEFSISDCEGRETFVSTSEFSAPTRCGALQSEFRLPAYGIPELEPATRNSTALWLWVASAAALAAATAAAVRVIRRVAVESARGGAEPAKIHTSPI